MCVRLPEGAYTAGTGGAIDKTQGSPRRPARQRGTRVEKFRSPTRSQIGFVGDLIGQSFQINPKATASLRLRDELL